MKILILANNDYGLYKFRKELIAELIRNGFEVFISLPNGIKINDLTEMGCKFIPVSIDIRGKNVLSDLLLLFKYIRIMHTLKPDIVLTYTVKPNVYGGLICRFMNIPFLSNITGLGSAFQEDNILKSLLILLYRRSISYSNHVYIQNSDIVSRLIEMNIDIRNYSIIPGSGVNLEEFKKSNFPHDEKIRFAFIGRIMEIKGIEEYLKLSKMVKQKYENVEFHVFGSFDEDKFKNIIQKMDEEGLIFYHGFKDDIKIHMKIISAVIMPSHSEGMSNVLLEAAAMGRVTIASDIPGCKEIIDDGVTGYKFKLGDVNDLYDKVVNFIELPFEDKKEMGKAARLKVEKEFDREIVIDAYMREIKKFEV